MEVMNLMFAIIGHVMASVLYVIRRFRSPSSSPKAIVDRSSILERKEELRKLWEKKMAEEQQAVVVEEIVHIEEESPEVKTTVHANGKAKIMNGDAVKTEIETNSQSKDLSTVETEKIIDISNSEEAKPCKMNGTTNLIDIDENSNVEEITKNESSLDVLQVSDETNLIVETSVVETTEQVFTSTLQQTLVITKTEESSQVEEVSTTVIQTSTPVGLEDQEDFEEIERRIEAEESQAQEAEPKKPELAIEVIETTADELDLPKEIETNGILEEPDEKAEHPLSSNADSLEGLDHQGDIEEEEDFVCVGDAVFAADLDSTGKDSVAMNGYTPSPIEPAAENGEQEEKTFDDHFVLDTRELESPSSDRNNEKQSKKFSGIKTEQPYSTCTTETKIAMEIREMREREEELKLMRERQAQISPLPQTPPQNVPKAASPISKVTAVQKSKQPSGYISNGTQKVQATPGYRVSSVFGRSNSHVTKDDNKSTQRNFNKESPVEREIRLAKDREEELRKQKGLPPREDDSFVKPSQVKSAQAKVFGKMINAENSRLMATAKIQHEIEEQTMRELALRETGSIQTLSSERTDSKVSKLKPVDTPECLSPTFTNGNNSPSYANGSYTNGHISPDILSKRSTPSPTGSNSSYTTASRNSPMMGVSGINKGISMQKFIASRGKETTFSASRNGPFTAKQDNYYNQEITTTARTIPEPGKLKRTLSVESKIQQEILEMKQREEELKLLHSGQSPTPGENGEQHNGLQRSPMEYQNGQTETQAFENNRSNGTDVTTIVKYVY